MLQARRAYVGAVPIAPIFRQIPLVSCVVNEHWNVDMEQLFLPTLSIYDQKLLHFRIKCILQNSLRNNSI